MDKNNKSAYKNIHTFRAHLLHSCGDFLQIHDLLIAPYARQKSTLNFSVLARVESPFFSM